ncbi:MAG: hypothetical protein NT155_02220 [Candidatus Staskawiczbacteria bacterium]|nr:hypothetical protein [Candidatus Staskawiczbacteria bacterium]
MRIRYKKITKNILLTLAIVGVVSVAATSPYFLINIARAILKDKKCNKEKNSTNEVNLSRSLAGLNKNRIIILKREGDNFTVRLTEKGKRLVRSIQFDNMKIEKQEVWDGKWRIVIFDIPERRGKHVRDAMRWKLQKLGFYQFQKSVWACPYPCEGEIRLLCEVLGASPFVNIITAQEIYNDGNLRKYFDL